MSDALCRLSTGGAFATRTLFTDRGETKFEAMRPTVLTGIGGIVTRGDLLECAVILHLPPVTCRRTEREFWSEFEKARPKLLGAIFNAVSNTLSRLGHTPFPKRPPRMADFAEWATAAGECWAGTTPRSATLMTVICGMPWTWRGRGGLSGWPNSEALRGQRQLGGGMRPNCWINCEV